LSHGDKIQLQVRITKRAILRLSVAGVKRMAGKSSFLMGITLSLIAIIVGRANLAADTFNGYFCL